MNRDLPRSRLRRLYDFTIRRPIMALMIVLVTITPTYAAMTVIDPSAIAEIVKILNAANEGLEFLENTFDAIERVEKTIGKVYHATVGRARRIIRGILGAKNCVTELDWMFDFSMPTSGSCHDFIGLVRNNLTVVAEEDATEEQILVELGNDGINQLKARRAGLHYDSTLRAIATAMQTGNSDVTSSTLNDISSSMTIPMTQTQLMGTNNDLLLVIAGELTQIRVLMSRQLEMQAASELLKTGIIFKPRASKLDK